MDRRDLTERELKKFSRTLWPARSVKKKYVGELKKLLDRNFLNEEEEEPDTDEQWKNFSAFCRKVGGFSWINALHRFEDGEALFTPLTCVLENDPDDQFVGFLLQMGADPNIRDGRGHTPLFIFLRGELKRYRTFTLLMERGANGLAVFGSMTMVGFAKEMKDNDDVSQMVWADLQTKYEISD